MLVIPFQFVEKTGMLLVLLIMAIQRTINSNHTTFTKDEHKKL